MPPAPPEPPELRRPLPPWLGPPDNELGVSVPIEPLLLVRTDALAVSLGGFVSYREGVELTLAVRRRRADDDDWVTVQMHERHRRGRQLPPEFLRFGVEFADGRSATNVGRRPAHLEGGEQSPSGPVLMDRGANGGAAHFDHRYWLWPLPPPGRLGFVTEWPSEGVALTRVDADAAPILDASTRATWLWQPMGGPGAGPAGHSQFSSSAELST